MTPSKAPLPFLGTWKLVNCESSRPDLPHPTSGITTFSQQDDIIHYTNDGVYSDGRTAQVNATMRMDGSWVPVTGSLLGDSLNFQHREDGSYEARIRKGGVDVGFTRATISADRQTMTGHWEIAGPEGATIIWKTQAERLQ